MADKHPLEVLKDLYDDSVKEADASGLSEIYKANTEALFKELPYSIEDIEYLDGYFIFGFGTNSVVHFHIKECPGWKFGIWWGMHIKTMTWEAGPKHGATTANMERYLRFAKQHGIEA